MRRQIIAASVPVLTASALLFGSQPAAAGGGCFQPDTQGAGNNVAIKAMCFTPTILYVQPGATVTWTNEDGLQHLVVGSLASWSGDPATLDSGQTVRRQFPTAGIFPYSCPLHYGMNAVVIVGDGKALTPLTAIKPSVAAASPANDPHRAGYWPLLALLATAVAGGLGYLFGRRRGLGGPIQP